MKILKKYCILILEVPESDFKEEKVSQEFYSCVLFERILRLPCISVREKKGDLTEKSIGVEQYILNEITITW